ncbi:glycosyltransferase family 2 protein [Methylocapsa palsarum]|uniref:Glycosyltransferase involved in cell wall bisynthesis n=1 Tax=Methylocapsa palsarum TaxID=1612308 RepID=A0A1I3XS12_9HYPH|nr:glycosyltransferase family 2 protein [Methylocapsa palsarum]SFK22324.1 Glycosyltransferase involved in cell wall bisynthesis [Methylocapsa palsarum]
MNEWRSTTGVAGEQAGAAHAFKLPVVSVIVVNYNYGRFLNDAVGSIYSQTYPNVECVVVDNASTDDSATILLALQARHPQLKVVRREANGGQTPAALDGLAATSGPYVIFVDADDTLLPRCVETHMFVHLSLRVHVGFSSGDMLQASEDQVVLGTEHAFNQFFNGDLGKKAGATRAYRHSFGESWPPYHVDASLLDRIRFVNWTTNQWVWSPTSGNCFRRDALGLFAGNPALRNLRTGTDLYFCLGINAVSGSVLIDEPVAVYRIHGGNIFSKRPQLDHVLCYQPGCEGDSNDEAKAILVDHLIDHADYFVDRGWTPFDYARLLRRIDCSDPANTAAPKWSRRSRVANQLLARFKTIAPVLGAPITKGLMFLSGVPWRKILTAR